MVFVTTKPVRAGDELYVSYGELYDFKLHILASVDEMLGKVTSDDRKLLGNCKNFCPLHHPAVFCQEIKKVDPVEKVEVEVYAQYYQELRTKIEAVPPDNKFPALKMDFEINLDPHNTPEKLLWVEYHGLKYHTAEYETNPNTRQRQNARNAQLRKTKKSSSVPNGKAQRRKLFPFLEGRVLLRDRLMEAGVAKVTHKAVVHSAATMEALVKTLVAAAGAEAILQGEKSIQPAHIRSYLQGCGTRRLKFLDNIDEMFPEKTSFRTNYEKRVLDPMRELTRHAILPIFPEKRKRSKQ